MKKLSVTIIKRYIFEIDTILIFHCGDSIEGKCVAAVAELKGPDWGNATKDTDKDAEVEN